MNFSEFITKAGSIQNAAASTGIVVSNTDNIGILKQKTTGVIDANEVVTGSGPAASGKVTIAAQAKAVVLVTTGDAGTTAENTYNIYYITGGASAGAAATVELVGKVTTDNVALTYADNFA